MGMSLVRDVRRSISRDRKIGEKLRVFTEVSTITSSSAQSLNLSEGGKAYAVIKASSVMVGTD